MSGSQILQKLKPGEKAKKFACALPHVGAGLVFVSAIVVTVMPMASHLNKEASEVIGKLGSEELFYLTLGIFTAAVAVGITYFALCLKKGSENKQLEQDNKTLKDGIEAVNKATNLDQAKANQVFKNVQQAA